MNLSRAARWLLLGAFLCLAQAATYAQDLIAPEGDPGVTYYAAFPVSITVDGDFSEWARLPQAEVDDGPQPAPDPATDGSLTFAAAADDRYLYLNIHVRDAQIIANQHGIQYWDEDSVEVYVNGSGDPQLTTYTPGVAQITFPAASIGRPIDQTILTGTNYESLGVRAVVTAVDGGYAVEASIPLHTNVWDIQPADGASIGFQVQLNGSSGQERDVKLSWSKADQQLDVSYQNPSVFGQLIFAPAAGQAVPTSTPAAVTATNTNAGGGFTVRGSTIYDPNGAPFVARGVNVNGYNWVWTRPTVPDAKLIDECWNFNLVRVNSFLFSGQTPYPQYDVNNDLDAIIQTFTSRGIVVVLEGHDRIGSYYQGADLTVLTNWFTDLARRYRDNPYVWFDVMNEPGDRRGIDVDQWVTMHGEVIHAIRDIAEADNVIIVEGAFGGQDAGNADASPVTRSAILQHSGDILHYNGQNYDNIVFSIHTYDLWNAGAQKMATFFDQVQAQNLALVIGEYGTYTDQDTQAAAQALFDTAPPRGIGLIVWHWDGSDANDLTVNTASGGGWEIDNCATPNNLSWLGQQVWNLNHAGAEP